MLKAGAASVVINNDIGKLVQGAGVEKCAERILDDSEANVLYLQQGDTAVLFISCDFACLEYEYTAPIAESISEKIGIDRDAVIIGGTHMHSGPSLIQTHPRKPVDTAYCKKLVSWLTEAAITASEKAEDASLGWKTGHNQIGYNRRCCWADGSHSMHGNTAGEGFTGLEGEDDPEHMTLCVRGSSGRPIAVLYNATTHPTCYYGADFYSADFPGIVRKYMREVFEEVPVLYFNGAFGDQSIENQLTRHHFPENKERKKLRAAHCAAGEILRHLHEMEFNPDLVLKHSLSLLQVDVRLPEESDLAEARRTMKKVDNDPSIKGMEMILAHGATMLDRHFRDNPKDILRLHAVRIGELGILTQPCELYTHFGLNIKHRSPAEKTSIFGICDGYNGYLPTVEGIMGGGYSGKPIYWTRLEAEAGYMLVDEASKMLHRLWRG